MASVACMLAAEAVSNTLLARAEVLPPAASASRSLLHSAGRSALYTNPWAFIDRLVMAVAVMGANMEPMLMAM